MCRAVHLHKIVAKSWDWLVVDRAHPESGRAVSQVLVKSAEMNMACGRGKLVRTGHRRLDTPRPIAPYSRSGLFGFRAKL